MTALSRRLGCSEGQLYTSGIGLVVAVLLLAIGLPPVLRDGPALATAQSPPSDEVAAVDAVPEPVTPPPTAGSAAPALDPGPAAPTTRPPRPPATASRPTPASAPPPPPAAPPEGPATGGGQLAVIYSGYTSSTAGTPLSGPEVPEDGLPVGARLGRADKRSFVRLAGTGDVLRLAPVEDPAANQLEAVAAVRACPITERGWSLDEPGAPPAEAPAYDDTRCVDAERDAEGTWAFDLGPLAPLDRERGLALVPAADGGATFQVTFSAVAAGAP